jgi:hypothetical protein
MSPPTAIAKITDRAKSLQRQLSAAPQAGHFTEHTNDPALRSYRAILQARINELDWVLKILDASFTIKPLL